MRKSGYCRRRWCRSSPVFKTAEWAARSAPFTHLRCLRGIGSQMPPAIPTQLDAARGSTQSWRTVRGDMASATGKAQEGEFAMSASIIRPVAAGHWQPFRVHGIAALRLVLAVMLMLYASVLAAEEPPSK